MKNQPKQLTAQEEVEMREGMALYEMTQTPGFKVLERMLADRAFHTWADPRETASQEEWVWHELNGFHASNTAKELLTAIENMGSRAQYLQKVKLGEIDTRKMRV